MPNSNFKQYFHLALVILVAVLLRLYFQIGHIFSDDSYYSYLSHTLLNGDFAHEYLGYPVFPLRMAFIGLTAFSMKVFGTNEFATLFFPFLFSLLNILLVYKTAQLFTGNNRIAIYAALLIAFFPTDVIFATIGFADLINIFFINVGIYFLLISHYQKKIYLAFIGGASFFLSMQFKENIYYALILLFILFVYSLIKNKHLNIQLLIGILFIVGNYLIEGFIYLLLHNDFFYRITITNINYNYSYYDFFPYTAQKVSDSKNYFRNLFDQIFIINAKSIFLRRFYLFLPIATSIQTYINFRKKEQPLLNFWFWGTAILMIVFTTSFNEYKPLDLARSWYIYPLLMPMIILSSIFINRFSKLIRNGLIAIYILGSLIMCFEYENFFDKDNLNSLKSFLRDNPAKMIYTDHFTKYSVDLIREYKSDNSNRILGNDFDFNQISKGDWILFNKKHIEELQMQKHQLPDFNVLTTGQFKVVASFNDFIFYERLH
ncbi:MAG: glycosyltransferase family 39 protein [Ignavibacteriaceae bacterium]|nr:glycosyltransferase family 39 protein [Ignavibacteriaceae bacterium]